MVLIDGAHVKAAHGYQPRHVDVTVGKIEVAAQTPLHSRLVAHLHAGAAHPASDASTRSPTPARPRSSGEVVTARSASRRFFSA